MTKFAFIFCILFIGITIPVSSQTTSDWAEGSVSYVTTNSVYLRFQTTKHINKGDTLFVNQNNKMIPSLVVANKSSLSCVCTPLPGFVFKENDKVFSKTIIVEARTQEQNTLPDTIQQTPILVSDSTKVIKIGKVKRQQQIRGRVSLSSYTNFSNASEDIGERMRYTFSLSGQNLGGSKFSIETYITFAFYFDRWQEIKDDIFNGLKIYNLSLRYDITPSTRMWLGRKINYKLTSIGAIDGLQFEHSFRSFVFGIVAGSRPDYTDYSINLNLFQFGIYLSHEFQGKQGRMENTLAFMNQTNDFKTDRRFLYFQHTNTLLKQLFFMGTAEFDLYAVVDSIPTNEFNLSNLYLLLRYKIMSNLSVSASYSARKNIIYYETYRDYLERLLESNTLQGVRLMLHYRPIKNLSVGVKGGYRYRQDDPNPSKDIYGYVSYNLVPGIKASATASVTWLETSYLNGWIYSIGLSRDLVPAKLYAGLMYRYVSYDFSTLDVPSVQHIAELNINWRVYKKLSLGAYYEGTFEEALTFNRIYVNLTQRF